VLKYLVYINIRARESAKSIFTPLAQNTKSYTIPADI